MMASVYSARVGENPIKQSSQIAETQGTAGKCGEMGGAAVQAIRPSMGIPCRLYRLRAARPTAVNIRWPLLLSRSRWPAG